MECANKPAIDLRRSQWRIACCGGLVVLFQVIVWLGLHDAKDLIGSAALTVASLAMAWMYLLDDVRTLIPPGRAGKIAVQAVSWCFAAVLVGLAVADVLMKIW